MQNRTKKIRAPIRLQVTILVTIPPKMMKKKKVPQPTIKDFFAVKRKRGRPKKPAKPASPPRSPPKKKNKKKKKKGGESGKARLSFKDPEDRAMLMRQVEAYRKDDQEQLACLSNDVLIPESTLRNTRRYSRKKKQRRTTTCILRWRRRLLRRRSNMFLPPLPSDCSWQVLPSSETTTTWE